MASNNTNQGSALSNWSTGDYLPFDIDDTQAQEWKDFWQSKSPESFHAYVKSIVTISEKETNDLMSEEQLEIIQAEDIRTIATAVRTQYKLREELSNVRYHVEKAHGELLFWFKKNPGTLKTPRAASGVTNGTNGTPSECEA